jgi:predicted amino acid dehydrogenase
MSVAWLCHLVDSDDLVSLEPGFVDEPADRREALMEHLAPRVAPVAMNPVDIRSITGATVRFQPILLPFTSHWVKQCIDARQTSLPRALVQRGADLARSIGCRIVSLGQYTSIVTFNGLRLDTSGLGVTSGNSYSVALAVQAVEHAQRQTGINPRESVLVVVGAAGNIGRACAELLAPRHRRTLLVGSTRPGSRLRLRELARRIPRARLATELEAVAEGDVVVVALNAVDAPLAARHFKPGALVCDLSVPAALQAGVALSRPDLRMVHGGIAALPGGEDLGLVGFPLPSGQVYGCMAEALLLAFDGVRDVRFTGSVTRNHVSRVTAMADRHGFTPVCSDRPFTRIDPDMAPPAPIAETPRFVPDKVAREETHAIAL